MIRNDSQSGLYGLQKGSNSAPIQYASIQIHKLCIERGAFPLFLHATGLQLIEEGQDDGSRVHADKLRGPACGARLKQRIVDFTRRVGEMISVDMFAAASNALTLRFMAWTLEPSAERVDAFSARSWDVSKCPHCEAEHREVGFYFPPSNLEDTIVRRARSDGARGYFLVPNQAKAAYWQALERESSSKAADIGCGSDFEHVGKRHLGIHSLFYVDFRESSDTYVPLCAQAFLQRERKVEFQGCEESEQASLIHELHCLAGSIEEPDRSDDRAADGRDASAQPPRGGRQPALSGWDGGGVYSG